MRRTQRRSIAAAMCTNGNHLLCNRMVLLDICDHFLCDWTLLYRKLAKVWLGLWSMQAGVYSL